MIIMLLCKSLSTRMAGFAGVFVSYYETNVFIEHLLFV